MQIGKINSTGISFKRKLTEAEQIEYSNVLSQARNTINKGGKSILIVHDSCLPQAAANDIGVGHLSSKTAGNFFDFAKNYLGINTIEVLPPGEIQMKHAKGFYNTYNGSALSLGTQQINLELLTEPNFNSILSKEDFQEVVKANILSQKQGLVNYENVIGKDSPQETALRKAFNNFINNPDIDKKAYESYKAANNDWLEPKSVYSVLKEENGGKNWVQWTSEIDRTLFDAKTPERTARIAQIKKDHFSDIEFYKFKQFIADEHLKFGKESLNKRGMKLFGDCLIGFSDDETWAFKDAFKKDCFVGKAGWKIPALDYGSIEKESSAAQKLLRRKVELFAKRYDGIRFDCSWAYVQPKLSDGSKFDFQGSLLDIIEDTVKSIKGKDFDISNLIHEFEADPKDFSIFNGDGTVLPYLKNRVKVISSACMDNSYGNTAALKECGINVNEYVLGVGNHDPQPLRQLAQNLPDTSNGQDVFRRFKQEKVLKEIMNLDDAAISTPADFVKFKFAEPLAGKNQMLFYMDAFGRAERFDSQSLNTWKNYRYRIPEWYEKSYLNAVEQGFGYNPMDGYAKVFEMKGYNTDGAKRPLYLKIIKFRDILLEKTDNTLKNFKNRSTDISKNRWLNISAVIIAFGLIATVISKVNKELQKQNKGIGTKA